MLRLLVTGFVFLLPLLEIWAFIEVGGLIGALPTIGLVIVAAMIGILVVRRQGIAALAAIRQAFATESSPVPAVVDSAIVMFAGLLLIIPGFVGDAIGLLLLLPPLRRLVVDRVASGGIVFVSAGDLRARRRGPVIEGEAVEIDPQPSPPPDVRPLGSPWAAPRADG